MSAKSVKSLSDFLSGPVARRISLPGRVVIRRGELTLSELGVATAEGSVQVNSKPICELVVGGQVVASGEINERDGEYYFVAQKETHDE